MDWAPRRACAGGVGCCAGRMVASQTRRSATLPTWTVASCPRDGFVRGYNGPIAVDDAYQVIVAHRFVTNSADDCFLVSLVGGGPGTSRRAVAGDFG